MHGDCAMSLLSPKDIAVLVSSPLALRRALIAVDYGISNVGFALAPSLTGSPVALPSFRQPSRAARGAMSSVSAVVYNSSQLWWWYYSLLRGLPLQTMLRLSYSHTCADSSQSIALAHSYWDGLLRRMGKQRTNAGASRHFMTLSEQAVCVAALMQLLRWQPLW